MGFGREAYRRGIESIGAVLENKNIDDYDDAEVDAEEMKRRRDALMLEREQKETPFWGIVIWKTGEKQSRFFPTLAETEQWYGDTTLGLDMISYAATWEVWNPGGQRELVNEYRDPSYSGVTPAPPGTDIVVRESADKDSDDDGDGPSGALLAVGAGLVLGGLVLGSQGKKGKGRK